jgi:hypothetical protein
MDWARVLVYVTATVDQELLGTSHQHPHHGSIRWSASSLSLGLLLAQQQAVGVNVSLFALGDCCGYPAKGAVDRRQPLPPTTAADAAARESMPRTLRTRTGTFGFWYVTKTRPRPAVACAHGLWPAFGG